MGRIRPLLTVAVIVVAVCAGAFGVRMRKLRQSSDGTAGAAEAQAKGNPFRSAVVELTFTSRSVHQGVEFLSSTGRRIEYIDAAGGRRREDYSSNDTVMGDQLPSAQSVTWFFDGAHVYISVQKDSKRLDKMMEIRQGFNQPIWKDAAVEDQELKEPGLTTSTEEFLGRLCKVYSISRTVDAHNFQTQKWWVWNGVTLRSEWHSEIQDTVMDTSEEAVRVEEDTEIDPSLFTAPPDIVFEQVKPTPAQLNQIKKRPAPWVRTKPEIELFWF